MKFAPVFALVTIVLLLDGALDRLAWAQATGPQQGPPSAPAPARPVRTARAAAVVDLTGTWVSVVTEDWRFRMVTPPKGDYTSIPLNSEGKRVADTWDWQKDQAAGLQCHAYGAPAVMRIPGRIAINWQDDNTLKIETDAGRQIRVLHFGARPATPRPAPAWQGVSAAEWENTQLPASSLAILALPPPTPSYALKVVTRALRSGYLRSNGVPYSANTVLTEYYDTFTHVDGVEWLMITTVVDDPQYLQQPFITTTHFRREPDGSKRRPTPCEIVPPTLESRPAFPQ